MLLLTLATSVTAAASAARAWGATSLVSVPAGVTDPNSDDAAFAAISNDGEHIFFVTRQRLAADDMDSDRLDVYARSAGVTRLVSRPTGVADPNSADAAFAGISPDGDRVFFHTRERLSADDSDSDRVDVYQRSGGTTTLVSQATGVADPDSDGAVFQEFQEAAGGHVFFTTSQRLTADDGDSGRQDVYDRSGGMTTLVSRPTGVSDPADTSAFFRRASGDGTRVFFDTSGQMTPDDSDSGERDVYERASGVTRLVSRPTGVPDPNSGPASFSALGADGERVFFTTTQKLAAEDGDSGRQDVYERTGGVTTLVSKPTGVPDPDFDTQTPPSARYVSPDGERVLFETTSRFSADDADGLRQDVYQRFGGATTLVSGPSGVPDLATGDAVFRGASGVGDRIFFESSERLTLDDTDGARQDVYEHSGGVTRLVSAPSGVTDPDRGAASFGGVSYDGTRVFFGTPEALTADDVDGGGVDIYERAGGETRLVSKSTEVPDPATADVTYGGATPLGSVVAFDTSQRLAPADQDSNRLDVYQATPTPQVTAQPSPVPDDSIPVGELVPGGSQLGEDDPLAAALRGEATRRQGLRSCLDMARRHRVSDVERARRLPASRRARALRHATRHLRQLRSRCMRRYGRTPGRVLGLRARAVSSTAVVLTFVAAGTDDARPPAARGYLIRQSRRPMRGARTFGRARALCDGNCRFPTITRVGTALMLTITDLAPRTVYYYAAAARDNVSLRIGRRSASIRVRTR